MRTRPHTRPTYPAITAPSWCNATCAHLRTLPRHRRPGLLTCRWRLSPGRWCLGRLDKLSGCPLAGVLTDGASYPLADHKKQPERQEARL